MRRRHINRFSQRLAAAGTILALCIAPACAQVPDETANAAPIKDKWALVIGISEFADPAFNLKYAAKDATDFRDFLIKKCNFAADHVRLVINENATRNKILDMLGDSWLPRVALPDDLVVIFISSHGSPSEMDVVGVNYVVAHDTNPNKLFTTGLPIKTLADTIRERVHSNRVLVILDACHSGGATDSKGLVRVANVDASQMAQGTGHVVISSSGKNELSWESKKYPNGVFTHTLIEALQKNGAQTKLGEAFGYLKDNVQQQVAAERGVLQTPMLETSKWKGQELVLSVVPSSPRAVPTEIDAGSPEPLKGPVVPAASPSNTPQTSSGGAPRAVSQIPDLSGPWIGSNGLTYNYWQKGRECGWTMLPLYNETSTGIISEDGKTLASSWSGLINGSGIAQLETDGNGRVIKISGDGTYLTRLESGTSLPAQRQIPKVSGRWKSNTGTHYEVWQEGNTFGWLIPSINETGFGLISGDGTFADCTWNGPYAGSCRVRIESDSRGRVLRMLSDNGMTMTRTD
jgi:hypothetical protein